MVPRFVTVYNPDSNTYTEEDLSVLYASQQAKPPPLGGSIRVQVDSVRKQYYKPLATSYIVICKGLDPPKRQYRCYVPADIDIPHAGDYLEIRRAGKDGKRWIFWS